MKYKTMADISTATTTATTTTIASTTIRTSSPITLYNNRLPDILQNNKLPSSISLSNTSANSGGENIIDNSNINVNTKLHILKLRKLDLDKKLNEKNILLQQLCCQEAQLIEKENCYALPIKKQNKIQNIQDLQQLKQPQLQQHSELSDGQRIEMSQQGLGGYWLQLNGNEKIWCTIDNHFASLDRRNQHKMNQKFLLTGQTTTTITPQPMTTSTNNKVISLQPPIKSTSLGNFDFLQNADDISLIGDAISISSTNSENKKQQRERQWLETSLDGPIIKYNFSVPSQQQIQSQPIKQLHKSASMLSSSMQLISPPLPPVPSSLASISPSQIQHNHHQQQQIPPILHYREKNKLSSHSMHSPGRGGYIHPNIMTKDKLLYSQSQTKPYQHIATNLDRSVSNSATTLTNLDNLMHQDYQPIILSVDDNEQYHILSPLQQQQTMLFNGNYQISQFPPQQQQQQKQSQFPPNMTNQYHNHQHHHKLQQNPNHLNNVQHLQRTFSNVSNLLITATSLSSSPIGIETITTTPTDSPLRTESPKNITIIQQAKFQPYKEVVKPFEMSDFYKYSTKFRQKNGSGDSGGI